MFCLVNKINKNGSCSMPQSRHADVFKILVLSRLPLSEEEKKDSNSKGAGEGLWGSRFLRQYEYGRTVSYSE